MLIALAKKFILVLQAAFLVLPCSSYAARELDNLKSFFDTPSTVDITYLATKARKIDWRYADAPKKLFNLLVDEFLLKSVPQDVRVEVKAVSQDISKNIVYYNGENLAWAGAVDVYMNFDPAKNKIGGVFLAEFKDSILEYQGLFHELDHLLVDRLLQSRIRADVYDIIGRRSFARSHFSYQLEKRAIFAEWLYIHLVDPTVRELVIKSLKERVFPADFKEHSLRWLGNAQLSAAQYLLLEDQAGRYSVQKFASDFSADERALAEVLNPNRELVFRCEGLFKSALQ